MKSNQYLIGYEEQLTKTLLERCTAAGFLDGQLLEVEELDEKWTQIAPEYMADAVPEFNNYPAVAIAWSAYIGMGMAAMWDGAWDQYKDDQEIYTTFRAPRGFDAMDEYVTEELLGIDTNSQEYSSIEELLRGCAHTAMSIMRKEEIEAQSTDAFYIFASTAKVFFRLGVAVSLKILGYKYEKVKVEIPD